jgi:hypothetical protein
VDFDVLEDVDAGPLILEERDDSVSVRDPVWPRRRAFRRTCASG